eukprot:c4872_g1_i1.p1 GENE.c4872_g1_i1~~c4872_g1_i1.p1  ORF type:complete len:335 (-),score=49.59 c4872_g1_i1:24-1028(-)
MGDSTPRFKQTRLTFWTTSKSKNVTNSKEVVGGDDGRKGKGGTKQPQRQQCSDQSTQSHQNVMKPIVNDHLAPHDATATDASSPRPTTPATKTHSPRTPPKSPDNTIEDTNRGCESNSRKTRAQTISDSNRAKRFRFAEASGRPRWTSADGKIEVRVGDLTKVFAGTSGRTAIVNAANRTLLGGGGIDHAVHKAAGPQLLSACSKLPQLRAGVRCDTGDVKVTAAFELPATYIFHTVGPIWRGGEGREQQLLEKCYRKSLELATTHHIDAIAFPAISTGIYGYPLRSASEVAVNVVTQFVNKSEKQYPGKVVFCCFEESTSDLYVELLNELCNS